MPEEELQEQRGSKGLDMKILALGLVLFVAAMAGSYLIAKSVMAPLLPQEESKEKKKKGTSIVVPAGEFTVNINDPSGPRYLKTEIYLAVVGAKISEEAMNEFMPVIKDEIITTLSSMTLADLDASRRQQLKETIKNRLNRKLEGIKIEEVYFTTFITQ